MSHYVKESYLAEGGRLTSISPASKRDDHVSIFRLTTLSGEVVIYGGLGQYMTFLTLLRSADMVICLDDSSLQDVLLLSQEGLVKEVRVLSRETLASIQSLE